MKVWNFLALLLLAAIAFSQNVTELTEKNFEKFIEDNPYVFVEFYATWCPHCQDFAPVFQALSQKAKEISSPFVFAKIDANEHFRIREKYNIDGYPTLKAFVKGMPSTFKFDYTGSEILDFLRRKAKATPFELKTKQDVQEIMYGRGLRTILISNDPNVIKEYEESAIETTTKNKFYRTSEEIGKQLFPDAQPFPATVLFKDFDEKKIIYKQGIGKYNLAKTLTDSLVPNIAPFTKRISDLFIGDNAKRTGIVLLAKPEDKESNAQFEKLRERIPSRQFVFVKSTYENENVANIKNFFDVKETEMPALVIASMEGLQIKRFIYKGPMLVNDMYNYWKSVKEGDAPRHYKSEPIPTENKGPVYKVVSQSWNKEVIEHSGDVIVKFYRTGCEECSRIEPIFIEVAKWFPSIKFVEVNGLKNEIPNRGVSSYPIILLLQKDKRNSPALLENDSKESMIESIKSRAGVTPIDPTAKPKTDL